MTINNGKTVAMVKLCYVRFKYNNFVFVHNWKEYNKIHENSTFEKALAKHVHGLQEYILLNYVIGTDTHTDHIRILV